MQDERGGARVGENALAARAHRQHVGAAVEIEVLDEHSARRRSAELGGGVQLAARACGVEPDQRGRYRRTSRGVAAEREIRSAIGIEIARGHRARGTRGERAFERERTRIVAIHGGVAVTFREHELRQGVTVQIDEQCVARIAGADRSRRRKRRTRTAVDEQCAAAGRREHQVDERIAIDVADRHGATVDRCGAYRDTGVRAARAQIGAIRRAGPSGDDEVYVAVAIEIGGRNVVTERFAAESLRARGQMA